MAAIGHGQKMSRKWELAIAGLLQGSSIGDAAKLARVSESSLFRWLRDEDFRKAYQEARREAVGQAVAQLQRSCGRAVEGLVDVLDDGEAPASAKVSASKTILELSLKSVEIENLEQRVVELEKTLSRKDV